MRNARQSKILLAAVIAIGVIYASAYINQFIGKGWRNSEAELLAKRIGADAMQRHLPLRVNTAQEYSDGCSFWALEIYWRTCFSVHIAVQPGIEIDELDRWHLRELVVSEFSADKARTNLIMDALGLPAKVNLTFEQYEEVVGVDGARKNNLINKAQLSMKVY